MKRKLLICLTGCLSFFLSPLHAAEPLRLVTMGDSITRGVRPGVKPEQIFAALVQQALIEKGIPTELTNAGIGGDTAASLKRLQEGVIARKPHLVTVMYGTNDSYVEKGKPEGRNSTASYETALREIISALQKAGIQPVLMTSPPWGEGAHPDGLNQHPNIRLLPYIEICRKVAQDMKVPLVDHYAHWTSAAQSGVKLNDWTTDFCHPNVRGHQEMAAEILRIVLPLAQAFAAGHP